MPLHRRITSRLPLQMEQEEVWVTSESENSWMTGSLSPGGLTRELVRYPYNPTLDCVCAFRNTWKKLFLIVFLFLFFFSYGWTEQSSISLIVILVGDIVTKFSKKIQNMLDGQQGRLKLVCPENSRLDVPQNLPKQILTKCFYAHTVTLWEEI